MKRTISHDSYMKKALTDKRRAAAYLDAAAEEGEFKYLLVAIRRIVAANGGMGALAKAIGMSRTSLYKALSPEGNPGGATLKAILAVYGLRLGVSLLENSGHAGHRPQRNSHAHYLNP